MTLRLLNFCDEPMTFTGHHDLSRLCSGNMSYDRSEPVQLKFRRSQAAAEISIKNQNRGKPQMLEFRHFSNTSLPIDVRSSADGFSILAKTDIRRGYVLDDKKIYEFGPLRAGTSISSQQLSSPTPPNVIAGLTSSVATYFELPQGYVANHRGTKNFVFGREYLGTTGQIVIVSTDESPSLLARESPAVAFSQVVWLLQFGTPVNTPAGFGQ